MKKALVMLLAFALVGGLFAAPDADLAPSVSGDATLSWGITLVPGLDSVITGFKNEMNAAVKMPLVKKATVTKGEGETYGFIELKDFELGAEATAVTGAAPAITAKIVIATALEIAVYSKPDVKISHIEDITDGDVMLDPSFDKYGTTVKYSTGGQAFGLNVTSAEDWVSNVDVLTADVATNHYGNAYALSAFANLVFAPVKVNFDIGANFDAAKTLAFGLDAPIAIAGVMKGLEIKPALDATYNTTTGATDPFLLDAGLVTTLTMSDNDADGNPSKTVATVYYSTSDSDIEASLSFVEVEPGMVPNLDVSASLSMWDILAEQDGSNAGWKSSLDLGYKIVISDTDNVHAGLVLGTTDNFFDGYAVEPSLTFDIVFTDITIAQTTITATYQSGDVLVATGADPDLGSFVLAAKVAY